MKSKNAPGAATVNASIGNVMRTARALTGLGLRTYAKRLNVSPATLSRIERDKGCDLATLAAIHKNTGIGYAILMGAAPCSPANGAAK